MVIYDVYIIFSFFQNCEALISTIHDTGVIMREIRVLEDQVNIYQIFKDFNALNKLMNFHKSINYFS